MKVILAIGIHRHFAVIQQEAETEENYGMKEALEEMLYNVGSNKEELGLDSYKPGLYRAEFYCIIQPPSYPDGDIDVEDGFRGIVKLRTPDYLDADYS